MIRALLWLIPDRALFKSLLILLTAALILVGMRAFTSLELNVLTTLWWGGLALGGLIALIDALWVCA
ncbi:MAG: hypothetical protein GYB41_11940, partial [Oceanospirillales bacterium]|nr:hypothetical protein [Oceanospirillales bacterium]